jgi:hypothetical protein
MVEAAADVTSTGGLRGDDGVCVRGGRSSADSIAQIRHR